MDRVNPEELMLKAISHIGSARKKHSKNPQKALEELDYALEQMNMAIDLAEHDIELRKERLKHFVGVTINSPRDLHETIHKDLAFFRKQFECLSKHDRSFYYFIAGNYHIHAGDLLQGKEMLTKCIKLEPESLDAKEAELILDTLYQ